MLPLTFTESADYGIITLLSHRDRGTTIMSRVRRKLLVNRPFQLKYLILTLGLMIVASIGLAWVTFYVIWSLISHSYPQMPARIGLYQVFVEVSGTLFWTTLTVMFAAVLIGGALVLAASRRTAGPMLRFRNVAKSIAAGETVAEVRLRKKDNFKESEQDINKVIKAVNELQSKNSEMRKEVSNIREKLSRDLEREIVSRESLAATVQKLSTMVAKFRSIQV